MDALGINFVYFAVQLCICGSFFAGIALPIAAIWQLRKRYFASDTDKILWVFIIIMAPFIGAIAFFILKPGKEIDP